MGPHKEHAAPVLVHRGQYYHCHERLTPEYRLGAYEPAIAALDCKRDAVAMIHGIGERWDVWETLLWRLNLPGLRSFSIDMPWSGDRGYHWGLKTGAAHWVGPGLEAVPQEVSVIVAHSLGANAVLEHLCAHGVGSLRAVILISPFYRACQEELDWEMANYYFRNFRSFLEEGILVRPGMKQRDPDMVSAMAEKVHHRIGPVGWLQFLTLLCRTPGLNFRHLAVPFFIIGGARDTACFPADCAALAQALPQGEMTLLPDCGHFSVIERPNTVLQLVQDFLQRTLNQK